MFQKFYYFNPVLGLVFFVSGIFLPGISLSQNFEQEIQQLKGELLLLGPSPKFVDNLNQISFAFRRVSHDSMRVYAFQAHDWSKQIEYRKGLAVSLKNLGNSYLKWGIHQDSARYFYERSIEISQEIEDYYTIAACYNNLALVSLYSGRLEQGISYLLQGLQILESNAINPAENHLKSRMWGNLGDLYLQVGNTSKALYYLEACIDQAISSNDKVILANYLDNLAEIQVETKEFPLAENNFKRAIALQRELADYQSEIHTLISYHKLKVDQGQIEEAEKKLRKALKLSKERGFPRLVFTTYVYFGSLYLRENQFLLSLQYGKEAWKLTSQGETNDFNLILLTNLQLAHEGLGDSSNAYYYLLKKTSLADSLRKIQDAKLSEELESQYRDKQQKMEIELLGEAQTRQSNQIKILSVFIGVLLGLLGLIYYLFQSKRVQSKLLARRNKDHEEIKRALEESNGRLTEYIDSNLQLENFAYMASHDLRAPLVNITAFSARLLETSKGKLDETEYSLLRFLYKNSQSMEALINSLLQYSRVNTQKLQMENIIPEEALCEVLDELVLSIEHRGANISVSESMAASIYADKVKLKQIFQNLLLNAVKFCPFDRNPSISVRLSSNQTHWQISVADNGIGISQEYQEQIFLLFRKLHSSEEYTGSGIGLAAVKRLVEQHKGKIWVNSKLGEGSTFYFTIHKNLSTHHNSFH